MIYFCHSGGCPGSDMCWENEGKKYGVKTYAYSFGNHVQESENQLLLTTEELAEGLKMVEIANKSLKRRPIQIMYPYVKNLLSRNWFQVKNSESIFAIGKILKSAKIVDGGTGWAVQMAIDNKKPVFIFDQPNKRWCFFNYEHQLFWPYDRVPKLTKHFAGIGTREINDDGIKAIQEIYKENLKEI